MVLENQKDAQKYAVFKIGEENFGIEINRVVEILSSQKVHSIPDLPDFLSGVITVRGQIIPLLDLRRRFGVLHSSGKELIIVIRYDNEKLGVLVDQVKEIATFKRDEILSPPAIFKGLKRKYLAGLGKKGDKVVIILNVDDLLTSEERIMLKETEEVVEEDAGTRKTD
jgi:purine-binding chemotaxis protein CheW